MEASEKLFTDVNQTTFAMRSAIINARKMSTMSIYYNHSAAAQLDSVSFLRYANGVENGRGSYFFRSLFLQTRYKLRERGAAYIDPSYCVGTKMFVKAPESVYCVNLFL